ncbi:MAG: YceI family protein [Acidobacteria bacterium]|nr:YceI family protein [Acidobacteriota bacterium]
MKRKSRNKYFLLLVISAFLGITDFAQPKSKSAAPHTYALIPSESSFTLFVAKTGLLSSIAHDHNIGVKSFSGRVVVPAAGPSAGSLELDVDAKSLVILDKISERDKAEITKNMNKSVLETEKFPRITFRSASLANFNQNGNNASFTLNGDLTLHGVTKRIAIPVNITMEGQNLRATGQYTLRQTDFGITPYSAALGTIKVKNEVVIKFNIVAR